VKAKPHDNIYLYDIDKYCNLLIKIELPDIKLITHVNKPINNNSIKIKKCLVVNYNNKLIEVPDQLKHQDTQEILRSFLHRPDSHYYLNRRMCGTNTFISEEKQHSKLCRKTFERRDGQSNKIGEICTTSNQVAHIEFHLNYQKHPHTLFDVDYYNIERDLTPNIKYVEFKNGLIMVTRSSDGKNKVRKTWTQYLHIDLENVRIFHSKEAAIDYIERKEIYDMDIISLEEKELGIQNTKKLKLLA